MSENKNIPPINTTGPNTTEPNPTAVRSAGSNADQLMQATQFGQLFEADKHRLYGFIHAFVSDHMVAEDIFQDTSLVLWQEFNKFEIGTNFSKWANVIAFYRISRYRNNNKKYLLGLSDDFLKEFSKNISIIESNKDSQEKQWRDLENCCDLLSAPLRSVYQSFYIDNLTAQEIATNEGRSLSAIRKVVHKLRKRLFDCVEQKRQGESL